MNQLVVILSILFSVVLASRMYSDVPLVVWSGDRFFDAQNVGISTSITYTDAELFLQSFIKSTAPLDGELSKYLPNGKPEVIVLFVESKLRSNQLSLYSHSFVNLKKLMETSSSSLYAPFVDLSVSFDRTITNMAYSTKLNSGEVIYFGKGSILLHDIRDKVPSTIEMKNIEREIKAHSEIFSNDVTDLIIVHLDSSITPPEDRFSSSDSILNRVQNIVSSKTQKYVGVYTALSYDEPTLNMDFAVREREISKRFITHTVAVQQNNTNTTIPIFRQYFGGWFWELILVCMVLIPMLVTGVYAIDAIQTPLFDSKPKQKKIK